MLKLVIDKLEDVEEAHRGFYKKGDDGKFYLELDNAESEAERKRKLAEFRDNNTDLKRELEAMKLKFKDIDPTLVGEANKALEKLKDLEEKEMLKAGDIDGLLAKRTTAMQTAHGVALKAKGDAHDIEKNRADGLSSRLSVLLVDSSVNDYVAKVKARVRPGAMPDLLRRAHSVWGLGEKEALVPTVGGVTTYGKDGSAIKMEEWFAGLTTDAAHLFEASKGGNAPGNETGGPKPKPDQKVVSAEGDEFMANVADIASGKVRAELGSSE